jgi:hypothetical protein
MPPPLPRARRGGEFPAAPLFDFVFVLVFVIVFVFVFVFEPSA